MGNGLRGWCFLLLFVLFPMVAHADENGKPSRKFAIGIPPGVSELGQSISLKYMFADKWGAQTILSYTDTEKQTNTYSSSFGIHYYFK